MKIEVKDKTVIIEIPFSEITHVYSNPVGLSLDTGEPEVGFGIEVHHKPVIDLKLQIKDGEAATEVMKGLSEMDSAVRLG